MPKPASTRRIAIVGLDGCGKSSVLTQLRTLAPARPGAFASITCPDFHDTPDAPLHRLSRQLKAFSDGCDEIASPQMKALSMYLQMTLYGPVERFILNTYTPDVLVCERHPLIETFVYGPLYALLAGSHWDGNALQPAITSVLNRSGDQVFGSVSDWHASETARLGDRLSLWQRFPDVAAAVQARFATAVADFANRYRTTLPDAVIWLDAPPEQAAARCAGRRPSGLTETHETPRFLAILRDGYLRFQENMAREFPHIPIHVVDTSDDVNLDNSVRACITEGQLFG